jgi:ABC-type branched-subunit amino acid transport system substrate-binding protein
MRRHGRRRGVPRAAVAVAATTALLGAACGASPHVVEEVAARRAAAVGGVGAMPSAGAAAASGAAATGGAGSIAAGAPAADAPAGEHPDGTSPASAPVAAEPGQEPAAGAAEQPDGDPTSDAGDQPVATSGAPAGGATDVGVTEDTIRIGSTFFNGGFLDKYSQASEQAVRAYINLVNDQGGIHGRQIELITCDTGGTVNGTQSCVRKLIEQDEVFMLGPSLDFSMGTVIPMVEERRIPWVGTSGLEDPEFDSPYVFPTQMRGGHVGTMMSTFADEELDVSSIGVSYLQNGAGPACLDAIRRLAEPLGYEVRGEAANGDTESDLSGQVTRIRQEEPDVIVFCNDPVNTIKFIQAASRQNYTPPKGWIGGWVAADDVPKAIGPPAVGMYGLSAYDFYNGDTPGVERYRTVVHHYYPDAILHFYAQSNFAGAEAMVQAIAKAGPDLTREGVMDALHSMRDYDTGMGLKLDFSDLGGGTPTAVFIQADDQLRWQQIGPRRTGVQP